MAKILITGASGFLGRSVIPRFLHCGDEVIAACSPRSPALQSNGNSGLKVMVGDLVDPHFATTIMNEMPDCVLHLAFRGFPHDSAANREPVFSFNLRMVENLISAMEKKQVRRLVFAGTGGAIYAEPLTKAPINEKAPTEIRTLYGLAKLSIENYFSVVCRQQELTISSLRISSCYGAEQIRRGRQGFIAHLLQSIHNARELELYENENIVKDFIHVDDVADAFERARHLNDPGHQIYNVGSGTGYSLESVIRMCERITGKQAKIRKAKSQAKDTSWLVLDSSRFQKVTQWRPNISTERGIETVWKYIREEKGGEGDHLDKVAAA